MPKPWKFLGRNSLLQIPPWLEVERDAWLLPDGRRIDDFYQVEMPPYVVVAPLTGDGRLVAERHFRPGARQLTLSLPSGYIDESEEPLTAAKRELREETGYEATRWLPLGRFVVDGNRGCGVAHLFLAESAHQVAAPDGKDLAEVSIELISIAEFLKAIENGGSAELVTAAAVGLAILRQRSADP